MASVTLKFNDREMTVNSGRFSIGRGSDNSIAFPGDSNVSRYHAQIESMGGEFILKDLGSSNGTTVNGEPVADEVVLQDGDVILLGGSSRISFETVKEEEPEQDLGLSAGGTASMPEAAAQTAETEAGQPASAGSNKMLMVAGGAVLVAVIAAAGAGGFYLTRGPSCAATATITSPEPGETIYEQTPVTIDLSDSEGCVGSVAYFIDDKEFARTADSPFEVEIDPQSLPEFADGGNHSITAVLHDVNGEPVGSGGGIILALETRKIEPKKEEVTKVAEPADKGGKEALTKEVSLIEIQKMTQDFARRMPGKFPYNVSNKQFLQEVQKMAGQYAEEGYYAKAEKFSDQINIAYVRDYNVPAQLGYLLAMSRSKFTNTKTGADEGIWRMSSQFAVENGYTGPCGTETLSDASQACAAKASAMYLKYLMYSVFDGDAVYSAVAFGKSPLDAAAWKATLPANRFDLWNSIRSAPEREQLVRFFAAGIVTENPQRFGLQKDQPLSVLYRVTM